MRAIILFVLVLSFAGCTAHDAISAQPSTPRRAQSAPAPRVSCKTTSIAGQLYTFCQ